MSGKHFALGLFGQHQHPKVKFETPEKKDAILRVSYSFLTAYKHFTNYDTMTQLIIVL